MNLPHTVIAWRNPWIYICRHENADYHDGTPWREVLNPLRYQVTIKWPRRIEINPKGMWDVKFANLIWRLKGNKPFPTA